MKASKFTDAQKAFIIKQREEGTPVAEIYRPAEGASGSASPRLSIAIESRPLWGAGR